LLKPFWFVVLGERPTGQQGFRHCPSDESRPGPWRDHPLRQSKTAPFRDVQRARILLRYHASETVRRIARALKMTRKSILKWIDKTLQVGAKAGMLWTRSALARHVRQHAVQAGLSRSGQGRQGDGAAHFSTRGA